MILFLYNLLFPIGLILFLPGYVVKMVRRGGYLKNFGQRFALYDRAARIRLRSGHRTWIHAVSVGEVAIALKLARELRSQSSKFFAVLSTTTTTGFSMAQAEAPAWLEVIYSPLDFWPIMRRAFRSINPARIVLVEAEIWPNLTAFAKRYRAPIALVNARLSRRSERRFRAVRLLIAPLFRRLHRVGVPEHQDVNRWTRLGVPPDRIVVTGSVKYDPEGGASDSATARDFLFRLGIHPTQPVILGGSTHAGEERVLLRAFRSLRTEFPSLFLIIAPRHVERAAEISAEIAALGLRIAQRSDVPQEKEKPDVLLLDTTGELRHWYPVATVAFVGKSLTARGGQNPVEAICAGTPVLFGPHMENFPGIARQLLEKKGAREVADANELQSALAELLRDEEARRRMIDNARAIVDSHRGATKATADLVRSL